MPIQLPPVIAGYFEADANRDARAIAECFTPDAIVEDEGHTHQGHEAIIAWKAGASRTYSYTVTPFAIEQTADRIVVAGHLEGDFPGSPIDLRYHFALRGNRIVQLRIAS